MTIFRSQCSGTVSVLLSTTISHPVSRGLLATVAGDKHPDRGTRLVFQQVADCSADGARSGKPRCAGLVSRKRSKWPRSLRSGSPFSAHARITTPNPSQARRLLGGGRPLPRPRAPRRSRAVAHRVPGRAAASPSSVAIGARGRNGCRPGSSSDSIGDADQRRTRIRSVNTTQRVDAQRSKACGGPEPVFAIPTLEVGRQRQ